VDSNLYNESKAINLGLGSGFDLPASIALYPPNMTNSSSLYRGHVIERVGHGKRAVFRTTINEKPWSALTLSLVKAGIDAWIDAGEEP
jgi:hypothetical protein